MICTLSIKNQHLHDRRSQNVHLYVPHHRNSPSPCNGNIPLLCAKQKQHFVSVDQLLSYGGTLTEVVAAISLDNYNEECNKLKDVKYGCILSFFLFNAHSFIHSFIHSLFLHVAFQAWWQVLCWGIHTGASQPLSCLVLSWRIIIFLVAALRLQTSPPNHAFILKKLSCP